MTPPLASRVTMLAFAAAAAGVAPPAPAQTDALPTGGARIERASFVYQRRIAAGIAGASSLRLDVAALAHSSLSDLRIATRDGFQVPYLLEADPLPLSVNLAGLAVVSEPEVAAGLTQRQGHARTVYAVAVPYGQLPPCALVIETGARVFEREVSLVVRGGDARGRESDRWRTAAWGWWRHADPDTAAAPLRLELPELHSSAARLVVDEGDNRPLPIVRASLELRTYRLRFFRESGDELWFLYGRPGLQAPRYDLALLQPMLSESPAREVSADPELPSDRHEKAARSTAVFWGGLIAAVVALLALLARLVRTPGQ